MLPSAAALLGAAMLPAAAASPSPAAPPAARGMKSIGVAVKAAHLFKGVEKTVFEHTLSAGATHGVMTEAWHAGAPLALPRPTAPTLACPGPPGPEPGP